SSTARSRVPSMAMTPPSPVIERVKRMSRDGELHSRDGFYDEIIIDCADSGVNSAARRIACFSARERTTPHSSTVPSWTITLSREVVSRADLPAICDLQGDFQ